MLKKKRNIMKEQLINIKLIDKYSTFSDQNYM